MGYNNKDTIIKTDFEQSIHLKLLLKFKILTEEDSYYKLNLNFSNKKIKLNLIGKKTKSSKEQKIEKKIDIDRSIIIQSVIVRIMKTRKNLNHNLLISQTINQIDKFTPKVSDIKKNVVLFGSTRALSKALDELIFKYSALSINTILILDL